jgi:hypothetical protein
MFNVRLAFARVQPNRRYELFRGYPVAAEEPVRRGRYVGPALTVILLRAEDTLPELAVLEVPGLPEVRALQHVLASLAAVCLSTDDEGMP